MVSFNWMDKGIPELHNWDLGHVLSRALPRVSDWRGQIGKNRRKLHENLKIAENCQKLHENQRI